MASSGKFSEYPLVKTTASDTESSSVAECGGENAIEVRDVSGCMSYMKVQMFLKLAWAEHVGISFSTQTSRSQICVSRQIAALT